MSYDLRPMLSDKLPTTIDPFHLCQHAPESGHRIKGELALASISELDDRLSGNEQVIISVDMLFRQDDNKQNCIEVEITAPLKLTCQRCMGAFDFALAAKSLISPIRDINQAEALPDKFEPLLVIDDEVKLSVWLAEEINLALPMVPMHEHNCVTLKDFSEPKRTNNVSPFVALKRVLKVTS